MRKRILSLVLLIGILSSFVAFPMVASATEGIELYAESDMPVSIKEVYCYYLDNKVTAEVEFKSVTEDGVVFLAIYDEGKFITVKQEALLAGDLSKNIVITDADESYFDYEAKIICFGGENSFTPISKAMGTSIVEYEPKIVRKLKAVSGEIALYTDRSKPELYTVFTSQEKRILTKIKTCIDDAILNHLDELTADFIKENYKTQIDEVKVIYDKMETDGKAEAFKGKMASNFTVANLVWLADTLGIDLSAYGINPDDYL